MSSYLIEMFVISLLLTLLLELPVVVLFGLRAKKQIVLAVLVNLLTNPPTVLFCWLGSLYLPDMPQVLIQILTETAVVFTEAYIYISFAKKPEWKISHPLGLAFFANICSWLLGRRFFI